MLSEENDVIWNAMRYILNKQLKNSSDEEVIRIHSECSDPDKLK